VIDFHNTSYWRVKCEEYDCYFCNNHKKEFSIYFDIYVRELQEVSLFQFNYETFMRFIVICNWLINSKEIKDDLKGIRNHIFYIKKLGFNNFEFWYKGKHNYKKIDLDIKYDKRKLLQNMYKTKEQVIYSQSFAANVKLNNFIENLQTYQFIY
jgi:hypothetical protein